MFLREREYGVHRFVHNREVILQILTAANDCEAGAAKPFFFGVPHF